MKSPDIHFGRTTDQVDGYPECGMWGLRNKDALVCMVPLHKQAKSNKQFQKGLHMTHRGASSESRQLSRASCYPM